MDDIWKEAIRQIPAIVVVVLMVLKFLEHIAAMNKNAREIGTEVAHSLEKLGDNCHAFQREMMQRHEKLMERTNEALMVVAKELGRNSSAIDGHEHREKK